MRKNIVASVDRTKSRSFDKLTIKFLRMLKRWPVSIAHEYIPGNGAVPYVIHKKTEEFVYLLSGEAIAYVGAKKAPVRAGDYLVVPPGVKHRFVTGKTPMVALSVFSPAMNWDNLDAVTCKDAGSKKPITCRKSASLKRM